jgi:hypothetical protein
MDAIKRKMKRPSAGARCPLCGGAELSSLPTFALGCGVAYRAIADDVYCRYCGFMGPPAYKSAPNTKPSGPRE